MASSMSSSISSAPHPPTQPPGQRPPREVDELSVASDFSIIPESLVDLEVVEGRLRASGAVAGGEEDDNLSTTSFLHSADLHISSTAMETHNKVIFHKLQPTYYQDSDIPVTYSLGSEVSSVSSDRIGLYRVGFTTVQDYIDYVWAPVPSGVRNGLPQTVVFKSTSFKKENAGDFFQFCYVTHSGQIVGVSTPFQLLRVGGSGEVEGVEEEEEEAGGGMVVVRSKESVLQEKLLRVSQEREQLQSRVDEADVRRAEVEKKVEQQTQQLSLCQHHLQALEVKLKRETSEKCELMGRVGQVVEERGHLEERLKVAEKALAGVQGKNTTLEEALKKSEARVVTLQEAALVSRKAGEECRLRKEALEEELKEMKEALQSTKTDLQKTQEERDRALKDIELWTCTAESDSQEKNSLALKYTAVTEELLGKEEALEETRRKNYTLEEKLEKTVEELNALKSTHSTLSQEAEELKAERKIHLEREAIVKGDMANLKERLAALEEDEKRERGGREAAENIACDLSSRLQAAKAEYQRLATTNHRLVKKLKRARSQQASFSESSDSGENQKNEKRDKDRMTTSTNSWVCPEMEEEEEEEEVEEGGVEVPRSMTQSTLTTTTTPSCCSHSTQQLSEVVNQKMEDIVRELSQQIMSLKLQLQEKEHVERVEERAEEEEKDGGACGASVEATESTERPGETSEVEQPTPTSSSGPVLYGKTFLPTAPTAPVFLPERSTPPQRQEDPQATPTSPAAANTQARAEKTAHTNTPSLPSSEPTPTPRPHVYLAYQHAPTLPPPLTPESTPTARQAAVLSQFTAHPTAPALTQHESDDEDFHSTDSDTDNSPPATITTTATTPTAISSQPQRIQQPPQPQQQQQQQHPQLRRVSPGTADTGPLYDCPMCSLAFPMGAARLLNEHIESHLAHVCPVCSIAFQRNCRDKFEEHVQSHFEEEESDHSEAPPAGNAGPWGETRMPHLLEFD